MLVPPENVTRQPRLPHMEVMNPQTGDVWLCQEPVVLAQFKALRVAPPLMKSGFTTGAMDAAHFLRSPGAAADGPLETCIVDGLTFARVARVVRFGGIPRGDLPSLMKVDKHHSMTFAGGRDVTLARLPDGQLYVEQTECVPGKTFTAPADWHLSSLRLAADWTVLLPSPVDAWFFASLRSFLGPVYVGGASAPMGGRG